MLIIGSRGFLGHYVASAATTEFQVFRANRVSQGKPGELRIDVTDEASVSAAFNLARPDVVVLLAAIADIDRCEQFPEEAAEVNFRGAERVADACARAHARLLFTSTGAVFDGRKHGYREEDPVSPVSVYGQSKAMAEKAVFALVPYALVIRIALAIGFAGGAEANGVLDKLKKQLFSGKTVAFPVFEKRNPIDAVTLSQFMLALLRANAHGVFHIGSQDSITRYDLGLKLASRMGYSGQIETQHEPIPGRAPRGPDHYLLTDKLRNTSTIPIPTCDQVIERCFDGPA
jgi:dTDP-4-dehydrorhamnose reductase